MLTHGQLHLTASGLMLDEVRSLLQKALRRGKSARDLALQACKELLFHGKDQLPWQSIFTFLFEDHCLTDEKILSHIYAAHSKGDKYACIEILLKCPTCRIAACLPVIALEPEYGLDNINMDIDVPEAIQGLIIGKNKCVKYDILLAHLLKAWLKKDEKNLMRYTKLAVLTHDIERRLPTPKGTVYVLEKPRRRPNIGMIVLSMYHRNTTDYKMRSYLYHCYRLAAALDSPVRLILYTVLVQVFFHDHVQRTDPEALQTGKVLWKSVQPLSEMPDWAVDKHTFRGRYGKDSAHLLKELPAGMSDEDFQEFHGPREKQDITDFFREGVIIENPAMPTNPYWKRTVKCYLDRPKQLQKTIEMEKVYHQELRMRYPELFHTRDEINTPAASKSSTSFSSKPMKGYTIPNPSAVQSEPSLSFAEALGGLPPSAAPSDSLKRKHDKTEKDSPKNRSHSERDSKRMKLGEGSKTSRTHEGKSLKQSSMDKFMSRPEKSSHRDDRRVSSSSEKYSSSSKSSSSSSSKHHSDSASKHKHSSSSSSSSKTHGNGHESVNLFEAALTGKVPSASSRSYQKEKSASSVQVNSEKSSQVPRIKTEPKDKLLSGDDFEERLAVCMEKMEEEESSEKYKAPSGPLLQLPTAAQKVYTCLDVKNKIVVKGPYPDHKYFRTLFYHKVMKDVFRDPHTLLVTPAQPLLKFPLHMAKGGKMEITRKPYRDVIQKKNIEDGEFVTRESLGVIQLHRLPADKIRKLPYTIWLHFMYRFLLNVGDSGLYNAITDSQLSFVKGIDMEEQRGPLRAVAEDSLVNYMFVMKPSKKILPDIESVLKKYADEYVEALTKFVNVAHIQRIAKQYKVEYERSVFQERLVKLLHAIKELK